MDEPSLASRTGRTLRYLLRETRYYGKIGVIGLFKAGPRGGSTIWEGEWDVLVVLDACRPDMLSDFEEQYDFICEPRVVRSIASYSRSWMRRTFGRRYADKTARTSYITGNPFSGEVLDGDRFGHLEEVWQHHWDSQAGTVLPRAVTDHAITHYRRANPDRMVVHYMQPHHPFIGDDTRGFDEGAFPNPRTADPWDQVRRGHRELDQVLEAYRDNLAFVLNDVEVLLSSIDAPNAVITADHANAVGEFGIYGHPAYAGIDAVRCVPWCETTASDTGEYDPQHAGIGVPNSDAAATRTRPSSDRPVEPVRPEAATHDPEAMLKQLGYR